MWCVLELWARWEGEFPGNSPALSPGLQGWVIATVSIFVVNGMQGCALHGNQRGIQAAS
jgi:hypothetical protein